ncbi:acyl-homoserine-lactone synthase [Cochlodiniinecator piscidefendens]|uniref:acyl-homoserine-lactone synthase n=1 Tax=Cochlodiniinecator piscidefendens TaxID=2715756 RepID=UPI00140D8C8E|nr:acyl-homoserine-lactone synthase [Cochlodiniinecator piscidefendens]
MENITFDLSNMHQFGTAFFDYLALRKYFFVDTLGWDIPHNDTVEMDQYDNPLAHYSLVLKNGYVVGGARAMPTTSSWGEYTYMLRDAVSGKLGTIPEGVMEGEVATKRVWECTRLVVSDRLRGGERAECLSLIVDGLAKTARKRGASELIALTRPSLVRSLRQLGYDASRIGEPYHNDGDGRRYAVLSMPTERMAELVAA